MERKFYKSKDLVLNHSFILYDVDDSLMYYFDNYYELLKFIKIPSWNLAIRYNKSNTDIINIVLEGSIRRLYTFEKEKTEE
ncbi:MAG: hypothetical protein HFG33_03640 [Bacilli bacterium]|nr:hypothetical protein [Bacilli bacterium]